MTVTVLQRKERRLKTRSRVRKQNLVKNNMKTTIKSPYKGESGIILEDK